MGAVRKRSSAAQRWRRIRRPDRESLPEFEPGQRRHPRLLGFLHAADDGGLRVEPHGAHLGSEVDPRLFAAGRGGEHLGELGPHELDAPEFHADPGRRNAVADVITEATQHLREPAQAVSRPQAIRRAAQHHVGSVREQDVALEQRVQRVERALHRPEGDGDADLLDEVVLEPLEGVAQRVDLDPRPLRDGRRRALGPDVEFVEPPHSAGEGTRRPQRGADRTAEAARAFARPRLQRALRCHVAACLRLCVILEPPPR